MNKTNQSFRGETDNDTAHANKEEPPVLEVKLPSTSTLKGLEEKAQHQISGGSNSSMGMGRQSEVKYFAKQVILREDGVDLSNSLPLGTSIIGKLLTSIDTRDVGTFIKVILPFGGSFKGKQLIPNNSILLGTVKYPGDGEKVYITFTSGTDPDGKEFKISAQAINTKTFTPGLCGDYHGTFGKRVAATIGLAFVSGATEVLQEKEAIGTGEGQVVAPKSTMRNALLAGTSKSAEMEAGRRSQELAAETPYVIIEDGSDLIVSLIEPFKIKEH